MKNKIKIEICTHCGFHTKHHLTKYGWRCRECGLIKRTESPAITRVKKMRKIIALIFIVLFIFISKGFSDDEDVCICGCSGYGEEYKQCMESCCPSVKDEDDDFGRKKPIICSCTAMYCYNEPCNICECSDDKTYKSW